MVREWILFHKLVAVIFPALYTFPCITNYQPRFSMKSNMRNRPISNSKQSEGLSMDHAIAGTITISHYYFPLWRVIKKHPILLIFFWIYPFTYQSQEKHGAQKIKLLFLLSSSSCCSLFLRVCKSIQELHSGWFSRLVWQTWEALCWLPEMDLW